MGLLDILNNPDNAQALGLLGQGIANRNVTGGANAAMSLLAGADQRRLQQQMMQMQMQQAQMGLDKSRRDAETETQMRDAARQAMISPERATALSMGPMPDGSNVPTVQPGFNMGGFVNQLMGIDPLKGMQYQQMLAKETPFNKLDPKDYTPESVRAFVGSGQKDYSLLQPRSKMEVTPAGLAYDPYKIAPGTALPDPNKPFSIGANGLPVPNTDYQRYELGKAKAGAPSVVTQVSTNTDRSYFGNVAEGLAKNDVAVIEAGRSAPDRVDTARRVKAILAQNPITGTGADARLAVTKALATAGLVDGKNVADTEMLAATLASQTLDSIKSSGLGGGNGFTNTDRDFLERAKAGKLDMTAPTLARIADLNERSALLSITRANGVIKKLRTSPQSGQSGAMLDEIQMPQQANPGGKTVVRTGTLNGRKVVQYSDGTTSYAD